MLLELELYNFRNFPQFHIETHPGINIITGANGSGKSSILESIFYLSRGRSFRTANSDIMIKDNKQSMIIRASIADQIILAVERDRSGKIKHKLSGESCNTMIELSEHLPALFLDTNSQRILASGPKNRRKSIDWGLFYGRKELFYPIWRDFRKCLLQRNAAIKTKSDFTIWDELFVNNSLLIDKMRLDYIADLQSTLNETPIISEKWRDIELKYNNGWSNDLSKSLANNKERDIILGHTSLGPHRADLTIKINGKLAYAYLSQGQQKLLTYAITAAQANLYKKDTQKHCLLLLDDICAELDLHKRTDIIDFLKKDKHQIRMTGIIKEDILNITRDYHHTQL